MKLLEMYWRPLSVYLFFYVVLLEYSIIETVFGGDSETIKVKNL
jgi:hypothetical protein